jgi:serine-type D-Ala-D-Ala carboxypeptidase/endopeptidase (penicillin-binding protein 4)
MNLKQLLATVCCLGMAVNAIAQTPLPDEVRQAMAKAGLPESSLGLIAFPLRDRDRGLRLREQVPLQPASTLKVVTAVVALEQLGANSRGRTDLMAAAPWSGDSLAGPLYVRGGADNDLDWPALWAMLRSLREQGLREIQGGLVVDRTMFKPARLDIGAPQFDEAPEFQYNVIPDALGLNGNLLSYALSSDAKAVSGRTSPAWPGISVDATAMKLIDKPCSSWEDGWQIPDATQHAEGVTLHLKGTFPRQCSQQLELNLIERQWLTVQALRQIWRELGGVMGPGDREAATPAGSLVLASHQGRPLAELMRGMMKRSDNPLTRLVYLRLGAAAAGADEDTLKASERVVRNWFAAKGIDASGLVIENGSGLSRLERIKPAQMAALLVSAWESPQAPELLNSMPVAVVDGPRWRRLKGSSSDGRARLKTGMLRNVAAVAGYIYDAGHQPWVLVAMLNEEQAGSKGWPVIDALAEWVTRQP